MSEPIRECEPDERDVNLTANGESLDVSIEPDDNTKTKQQLMSRLVKEHQLLFLP